MALFCLSKRCKFGLIFYYIFFTNNLAKLRRHASRVHLANIHLGWIHFWKIHFQKLHFWKIHFPKIQTRAHTQTHTHTNTHTHTQPKYIVYSIKSPAFLNKTYFVWSFFSDVLLLLVCCIIDLPSGHTLAPDKSVWIQFSSMILFHVLRHLV